MIAEVRLIIAASEARLVLKHGEKIIEDEVWTFPHKISRTEAKQAADTAFHDIYDLLQYTVNGDDDS